MSDNGHRDDPDPIWDLGNFDDEAVDAGRRRVPLWVIVIAILIALALILQLAWPLVADLLDRGGDSGGFPTPGVV
jgi:phosphotransferase system  glucose/maltose/N-acetylglucosamine-specific IIC component